MAVLGPNSPSSGTDVAPSPSGTYSAWTNPGNILSSDNVYAQIDLLISGDYSEWVVATDFGFALPSWANITSIVVEIEEYQNDNGSGSGIYDFDRGLVPNNTWSGETIDQSFGLNYWSTSEGYTTLTYTSSFPSVTDINSAWWGFALLVGNDAGVGATGYIDHIRITINYTGADYTLNLSDTFAISDSQTRTLTETGAITRERASISTSKNPKNGVKLYIDSISPDIRVQK